MFVNLSGVPGFDLAAVGGVSAMLDQFDNEVGLHYLRAIHLNDSKGAHTHTHTHTPQTTHHTHTHTHTHSNSIPNVEFLLPFIYVYLCLCKE